MNETFIIAIIIFIIAILLILFELKRTHDFFNPFVIFMGLWGIIVFSAGMALFGMKPIEYSTYIYIFIGLMSFAGSWFLYEMLPRVTIKQTYNWKFDNFKSKLILVILIICLMFYMYYSWKTFCRLLSGYSFVDIRNIHQGYVDETAFKSNLLSLVGFVFCSPFLRSIFCIAAVNYMKNGDGLFVLILSAICTFLEFFSTASRFSLIYVILVFFILLLQYRNNLQKKTKKRILYLIFILIIAIIVMVWLRSLGKSSSAIYNIFETLYHYLASPVPMFNAKLKRFSGTSGHTYGKMFVYGFLDLFDSILKYTKIADIDLVSNAKYFILDNEKFVRIYDEHHFNAFVSIFYYFYIDLGLPGIILGSGIWARMLHFIYDKYRSNSDIGIIAVFCEFVYFVMLSGIRWPFSIMSNVLLVIYTLWLTSKVNIRIK